MILLPYLLSLILLASITPLTLAQKKCRALVIQGGGDKGAYEAGVLYGFVSNTKNPEDFQYDVITGVSVGALSGICLAQFAKGDEVKAVDYLTSLWQQTKKDDIYVDWPGGILEGLLEKSSVFNNNPELEYLQSKIVSAANERKITVVTTDANTGAKITFSEQDWQNDTEAAVHAALYSSAVPILFIPRNVGNHTFIDGGLSGEGLDVEDAIARCREVVDDDKDIIIDTILANNATYTDIDGEKYKSLQVLFRYIQIQSYMISLRAITFGMIDYPEVNFRYIMIPSQRLPDQDIPLDFNSDNIKEMLAIGEKDAIKALEEGPEVGMERVIESMKFHQFR